MDMSDWFTNTISTKRLVSTQDSGGGVISTFSTHLTSVDCLLQEFKGQEPIIAGRKFSQVMWTFYCSHDEDILMKDIITYESVDYEIVSQGFEENEDSYQKLLLAKAE